MRIAKNKINKLIDVSNNRCGIDIYYIKTDGEKGIISGCKKNSIIDYIQKWFDTMEMKEATVISIHGSDSHIDFENLTINNIKIE